MHVPPQTPKPDGVRPPLRCVTTVLGSICAQMPCLRLEPRVSSSQLSWRLANWLCLLFLLHTRRSALLALCCVTHHHLRSPISARCCLLVQVELPLNRQGTKTAVLQIALTSDGSQSCKNLMLHSSNFVPPPTKFVKGKVLPPNW